VFFENPEFDAVRYAEADREQTPAVIGSDTPVDPGQLMRGPWMFSQPGATDRAEIPHLFAPIKPIMSISRVTLPSIPVHLFPESM
jgi:hypothetical protein